MQNGVAAQEHYTGRWPTASAPKIGVYAGSRNWMKHEYFMQ